VQIDDRSTFGGKANRRLGKKRAGKKGSGKKETTANRCLESLLNKRGSKKRQSPKVRTIIFHRDKVHVRKESKKRGRLRKGVAIQSVLENSRMRTVERGGVNEGNVVSAFSE